MNFPQIFNIFSRRHEVTDKPVKPLTPEFKNRVLLLCRDTFPPIEISWNQSDLPNSGQKFTIGLNICMRGQIYQAGTHIP